MKKWIKILLYIIIIFVALWLIAFGIDFYRCSNWLKPIFVRDSFSTDLGYMDGRDDCDYFCLGYRVSVIYYPNFDNQITYVSMSLFNIPILRKERDVREITNNMEKSKTAVIIKVNENSLNIMEVNNTFSSYEVQFSKEGNIGFKKGQEIIIYHDGLNIWNTDNIGKIEIIKEKSDIIIPDNLIKQYYSSRDKVQIYIEEFTLNGITLNITDTNEYKYSYSNKYTLYKENTEKPDNTIKSDGNSMSIAPYDPWIKIASNDVGKTLALTETFSLSYDWTEFCGELKSGKYWLNIPVDENILSGINIYFNVNDNGEIKYDKIQFR